MGATRLLIIDDDPEIVRFLARVAEGCGYDVRTAADATRFRELYRAFGPDLIALDLAIPEVDGIELISFLAGEHCQARLLIISGFDAQVRSMAGRLGEAHGLRIAGILPKPVRVAELRATLDRLRTEN